MNRFKFVVYPSFMDYAMYIARPNMDGSHDVVTDMELTRVEPNTVSSGEPSMRLSQSEVQQLMDSLWQAGIRPSNGEGAVGQIGAVQNHLNDIRKIAFHFMGVEEK